MSCSPPTRTHIYMHLVHELRATVEENQAEGVKEESRRGLLLMRRTRIPQTRMGKLGTLRAQREQGLVGEGGN